MKPRRRSRRSLLQLAVAAVAAGLLAVTAPMVLGESADAPLPADEAAEWRWLMEAPAGYMRFLDAIAGEYVDRYGTNEEPPDDVLEARIDELMPFIAETGRRIQVEDQMFRRWSRHGYRAWADRRPGGWGG